MASISPIKNSLSSFPHLPLSRREFLRMGTVAAASAVLPDSIFGAPATQETYKVIEISNRPKPLIILWLQGGASHFDTFDPKPNAPAEIKGPFNSIDTTVPGVKVTDKLPLMARKMHEVALFRNLYHRQGDHGDATRLCLAGSHERSSPTQDSLFGKPKLKPALVALSEHISRSNIGYTVFQANDGREPYGGIQQQDALYVQCEFRNNNVYRSPFGGSIDRDRLRNRMDLLRQLEQGAPVSGLPTQRFDELRDRARSILDGDLNSAFDLNRVSNIERDRYGRNPMGNAALISKRLVQAGAPLILINDGWWDSHWDLRPDLERLVPRLDKALAALMDDLRNECIIVVASEFGRTPRMNNGNQLGRDHWPDSNFMLVTGRGVTPRVVGQTRNDGVITGNDGAYNAKDMGEAILNLAGYARVVTRNGVETSERFPTLPIFR